MLEESLDELVVLVQLVAQIPAPFADRQESQSNLVMRCGWATYHQELTLWI